MPTTKKAAPAKKPLSKKAPAVKISKGDGLVCGVCGFSVVVDEVGIRYSPIICCEEPMKVKKAAVKKAPPKATFKKK